MGATSIGTQSSSSWLCAQRSSPAGPQGTIRGAGGMKPRSATSKVSTFPAVPSPWPQEILSLQKKIPDFKLNSTLHDFCSFCAVASHLSFSQSSRGNLYGLCWGPQRAPTPHLARGLDSLPDAEVAEDPGEQEAQGQLPAQTPQVLDTIGDLQDPPPADTGQPSSTLLPTSHCSWHDSSSRAGPLGTHPETGQPFYSPIQEALRCPEMRVDLKEGQHKLLPRDSALGVLNLEDMGPTMQLLEFQY